MAPRWRHFYVTSKLFQAFPAAHVTLDSVGENLAKTVQKLRNNAASYFARTGRMCKSC